MGDHPDRSGGPDQAADTGQFVKRGSDPGRRAALRHEADVLGRLRHPGVVRLLVHRDDPDAAVVITERIPGSTLADDPPTSASAIEQRGAAIAAVLADLHGLGIAHGGVAAEHVLVDRDRVVLCSFTSASDADADRRARDLTDLCTLLLAMLEAVPPSIERAERRARSRLRSLLGELAAEPGAASEVARQLARPVAKPAVSRVRSMLAGREDEENPPVRTWRDKVPPLPAKQESTDDNRLGRRRVAIAVGAALGVASLLIWTQLLPERTPDSSDQDAAVTSDAEHIESPPGGAVLRPTPVPTETVRPTIETIGNLIAVDGVWYRIGGPGDLAYAADVDCDGTPNAVVLRPGDERVFVFDGWSRPAERRTPVSDLHVPGAVALVVTADRSGCESLAALDSAGRRSPVEVAT